MKKQYINPIQKVVTFQTTDTFLLAGSLQNSRPVGESGGDSDDKNQFVKSQSQWDKEW